MVHRHMVEEFMVDILGSSFSHMNLFSPSLLSEALL